MSVFPPQTPVFVEDIHALAGRTSSELARVYTEIASAIGTDRPTTGKIFGDLADWERAHMRSLSARHGDARVGGRAPVALTIVGEEERLELARSALTSPYRALSAAVMHCDRAFTAWAYIAAELEDTPARAAAEQLAMEALTRADALRKERRRAWRADMQEHKAGSIAGKERLLRAEMRDLPARQALRPDRAALARLTRDAEELTDIYIDRVTKARNAADALRARRRAALSLQRLRSLRGAAHGKPL